MSKAILDALKTRLYATTALTTTFGSRIYLDVAPANASLPLMVYRAATDMLVPHFGGVTRHDLEFEFQLFFDNTGSQTIHTAASQLATALSTPITVTGFDRATFVRTEAGIPSRTDDSWSMTERYRATAFDI